MANEERIVLNPRGDEVVLQRFDTDGHRGWMTPDGALVVSYSLGMWSATCEVHGIREGGRSPILQKAVDLAFTAAHEANGLSREQIDERMRRAKLGNAPSDPGESGLPVYARPRRRKRTLSQRAREAQQQFKKPKRKQRRTGAGRTK